MKTKHVALLLILICALVLGSRLYFAFSTPYFSSDTAYFQLRQVEHIRSTGLPIFEDTLSWSGRTFVFSPVFHYIIAFFSLFMPVDIAAKVLPNIFAMTAVILVYLIAKRLTKNDLVSLTAGFASGFIPAFFANTFNTISPLTLVIPAILLLVYSLMQIEKTRWVNCYIVALIALSFAHPFVLVFSLGLLFYLLFVLVEQLKQERAELEVSLFSIFFTLWAQFLIYKKLLTMHGLSVIWQNIPKDLVAERFASITTTSAIYQIGIIPFILGIYVIYKYLFKQRLKKLYLIIGFAAATGLVTWLKLVELQAGLVFFGIALVLLFAEWMDLAYIFVVKTKVSKLLPVFAALFLAVLAVTLVLPSFAAAKTSALDTGGNEIKALEWIKENTGANSTILAFEDEGNKIAEIAQRKNVIDSNFLLRKDAAQRYEDIRTIFSTQLETEAIGLIDKYGIDYIYVSKATRTRLGAKALAYANTSQCFELVYDNDCQIYHKLAECRLVLTK